MRASVRRSEVELPGALEQSRMDVDLFLELARPFMQRLLPLPRLMAVEMLHQFIEMVSKTAFSE
jgi:hypothetical protein